MALNYDEQRFLLFAGYTYYPGCAWEDFRGAYATQEEARDACAQFADEHLNWYQIVDRQTLALVEEGKLSDRLSAT